MMKKIISVTSHAFYPLPLSQTVTPSRASSPLECDVLYGRPHGGRLSHCGSTDQLIIHTRRRSPVLLPFVTTSEGDLLFDESERQGAHDTKGQ